MQNLTKILVLAGLCAAMPAGVARADETADGHLPLPRFVNLGSNRVNMRQGPDRAQPILWIYQRNGLPVKIVAESDTWRKIEDIDGTSGWVQSSLLSGKSRHAIVIRPTATEPGQVFFAPMRALPDVAAPLTGKVEAGVILAMTGCQGDWIKVDAGGTRGWIERRLLWGLLPEEPELCKAN